MRPRTQSSRKAGTSDRDFELLDTAEQRFDLLRLFVDDCAAATVQGDEAANHVFEVLLTSQLLNRPVTKPAGHGSGPCSFVAPTRQGPLRNAVSIFGSGRKRHAGPVGLISLSKLISPYTRCFQRRGPQRQSDCSAVIEVFKPLRNAPVIVPAAATLAKVPIVISRSIHGLV